MTASETKKDFEISVIIAHLNQPQFLQTCLESLHRQTIDMNSVEIIVVDNGSKTLPLDVIAKFRNVKLELEPTPGPGPARNKGVVVSSAPILAFIDADCVADKNWLSTILRSLTPPTEFQVIGGRVKVGTTDPERPNLVEAYEQVFAFRQRYYIEKVGFSGTGNLAMSRQIFCRVGPFAGIEIAEDKDWGLRAKKLGYRVSYLHDMCVTHPARQSLGDICNKLERVLSHDFAALAPGIKGKVSWLAKAGMVAASPLVSVVAVFVSPEMTSLRSRILAAAGLFFVRFYRARRMFSLFLGSSRTTGSQSWNRD